MNDAEDLINNSLSYLVETPYDGLIAAGVIDDALYGQFITNGQVHDFKLKSDEFIHQEYHPDSIELNEFALGYLDSHNIRCDSEEISSFEYLKGIIGIDSFIRKDRKAVVCKKGGVACGGRCLPKGQQCRKGVAGAVAQGVKSAISKTRQKGTIANKLAKAALIGAGLVAASKVVGKGADELHTEASARLLKAASNKVGVEIVDKDKLKDVIRAEKEFNRTSNKALKEIKTVSKVLSEREGNKPSNKITQAIDDLDTKAAAKIGTAASNALAKKELGIENLVKEEDLEASIKDYKKKAKTVAKTNQKANEGVKKGRIKGLSTQENQRVEAAAERIRLADQKRRQTYKKVFGSDPGSATVYV